MNFSNKSLGSRGLAIDLLSFAFESPFKVDQEKPLYIDAEDATKSLNAAQLRKIVRSLIAGLKAAGLRNGDNVLVNLANNVSLMKRYKRGRQN
jgi:hypothetical protein